MTESYGLLPDSRHNGATIVSRRSGGDPMPEKTPFLAPEPVRLTPAWEESNLPNDTLNLKGMTMEAATLEVDPPSDRRGLVYLTLLLHGIGALTPWNMFITAKSYFVEYKLGEAYTGYQTPYSTNFLAYVGLCSQVPNLLFNWINIFIQVKSNLTVRIVWSISMVVLLFVGTIILAMVDSSTWPGVFFWLTMLTVVLLNVFNGIFQNSVYGMAARLPPQYTGAVVLGSNVAGCLAALSSVVTNALSPSHRTSAVYYFLTALLILLACFDTYFALPLNRFYRYHELMASKAARSAVAARRPPYWRVFRDAFPQLLNVFMVFFVSLAIFPAWNSDVKRSSDEFFVPLSIFTQVTCFLTFNITAMLGSSTASLFSWPGPRFLCIFVWARLLLLPLFLLCNYQPMGTARTMAVLIPSDWAYWALAVVLGWSNGHFSSLAMMYIPGSVEKQYASTAGMFGAAVLITGIVAGIAFSMLGPLLISLPLFKGST